LLFVRLITAAERWRGVRVRLKILRTLDTLRAEGAPEQEQVA
jgi:hypothetical protein